MRSIEHQKLWEEWVSTFSDKVQETARQYPLGTRFKIHDKIVHVISYNDDGSICVTDTDPFENYQKAVDGRQPVCKCCIAKLDSVRLPDAD